MYVMAFAAALLDSHMRFNSVYHGLLTSERKIYPLDTHGGRFYLDSGVVLAVICSGYIYIFFFSIKSEAAVAVPHLFFTLFLMLY